MRVARDEPYVTVLEWPSGHRLDDVLAVLAPLAGSDVRTLELRAKGELPLILGRFDARGAERLLARLFELGGDGFAVTMDQLVAVGPSEKIRDMRVDHGALAIDFWRGPSETVPLERIEILVRAHLNQGLAKALTKRGADTMPPTAMGLGIAFTSVGLATRFDAAYRGAAFSELDLKHQTRTSDKLDVHTTDGRVLQIDGDKFGFRVLGDLRGHGDKANMDRTLDLLSHLAPNAVVDPFFPLWRPPPGADRFRLPRMHINNEDPRFAFYSRWAATLYRHLMHG